jgi:oxidoreductase
MSKILVLGATGACGRHVVREGLNSNMSVRTVGRRKDDSLDSSVEQVVVDMNNLESLSDEEGKRVWGERNTLAMCLGTTRAQAGSTSEFTRIDYEIPLTACKQFYKENPHGHLILLSASGSNINSPFLYPKTKGQLEQSVQQIGFPRVSILQPGFLEMPQGETRSHSRWMESVAASVLPVFRWIAPTKIAVSTVDVGKAIVKLASDKIEGGGTTIYSNADIQQLAKEL